MADDENDEFDEYNVPLDVEHLPYVTNLPPSPVPTPPSKEEPSQLEANDCTIPAIPQSPKSVVSDEFAAYDLSEFTAEELAALESTALAGPSSSARPGGDHPVRLPLASPHVTAADGDCSDTTNSTSRTPLNPIFSGPAIDIELEQSPSSRDATVTDRPRVAAQEKKALSPQEKYHRNNWFRTTDLTSPIWCEYMYEYRFLQEREKKKPDQKQAETIITPKGNAIPVDIKRVEGQHAMREAGKSVHRVLEREIHPVEIKLVKTDSIEEKWALIFTRMMESVQSLITIGRCREMEVFGLLHGEVVRGVIDEVVREPLPVRAITPTKDGSDRKRSRQATSLPGSPTKRKPQKVSTDQSPSQTSITSFFADVLQPSSQVQPPLDPSTADAPMEDALHRGRHPHLKEMEPQFCLRISDTKTRNTHTMPHVADTDSARYQLMIYHRLLSGLLAPASSPDAIDFSELWRKLGITSNKTFSPKFHQDAELPPEVDCIDKMVNMWRNHVEMTSVRSVHPELTVEYRIRKTTLQEIKRKSKSKRNDAETAPSTSGDGIRAAVVFNSLPVVEEQKAPTHEVGSDVEELKSATKTQDSDSDDEKYDSVVIGQQVVLYDSVALDNHLSDIFQWWRGERPSRGVAISQTRRCSACAFASGCEWREQKALEFTKGNGVLKDMPLAGSSTAQTNHSGFTTTWT
ncbi:exonuclease V [Cytidiella melzeri]|nr:exonuclease V [Cytidiella melzeri]